MAKKIFIILLIIVTIIPLYSMNQKNKKNERSLISPYKSKRALGLSLLGEALEEHDLRDGEYVKTRMLNLHKDFTKIYNDHEEREKRKKISKKKKSRLNKFKTLNLFEQDLNIFKRDKKN